MTDFFPPVNQSIITFIQKNNAGQHPVFYTIIGFKEEIVNSQPLLKFVPYELKK
jgi:hypothetical protein